MTKRIGTFGKTLVNQLVLAIEVGTPEQVQAFWVYIEMYKKQFDLGLDVIDSSNFNLVDNEILRSLTAKELHLYSLLRQSRGKVVSSKEILLAIWGNSDVIPYNLENLLEKLKKKVEHCGVVIRNSDDNGYWME